MTFQTDCINAHKLQDLWENGGNFTDLRIKMTTQDVFVHSVIIHARSDILSKLKTRDDAKEICFPVNVSEKSVLTSVKHIYSFEILLEEMDIKTVQQLIKIGHSYAVIGLEEESSDVYLELLTKRVIEDAFQFFKEHGNDGILDKFLAYIVRNFKSADYLPVINNRELERSLEEYGRSMLSTNTLKIFGKREFLSFYENKSVTSSLSFHVDRWILIKGLRVETEGTGIEIQVKFKGFEGNKESLFSHKCEVKNDIISLNNVGIQMYGKSMIKIKITGTGKTVSCVPCAQFTNTIPTRDANGKFRDYVKFNKITTFDHTRDIFLRSVIEIDVFTFNKNKYQSNYDYDLF